MKNTIVISYYDGGYYWSFASGNRIYCREDYKLGKLNKTLKVEKLGYYLEKYPMRNNALAELVKMIWPKCERIIICEDGNITILNIGKGVKTNANE